MTRCAQLGIVALTGAALLALAAPARAGLTSSPPPLPAQPGSPPTVCRPLPRSTASWTPVYSETTAPPDAAPAYELRVDPWSPCTVYRARSTQTLDRSSDGGRTWQPVFDDAVAGFSASSLAVPGPDAAVLGERGNGDAVVGSTDVGTTWRLAGSGTGGPEGQAVQSLTFAPGFHLGRSGTAYATVASSVCTTGVLPSLPVPLGASACEAGGTGPSTSVATTGLYVTQDGAGSWSPLPFPALARLRTGVAAADCPTGCLRRVLVQVDPADPGHVWAVLDIAAGPSVAGMASPVQALLFEKTGQAPAFTYVNQLDAEVSQLLVARTQQHPLRLYFVLPASQQPLRYSDDDGSTVSSTAVAGFDSGAPALALDPLNNDVMLLVGTRSQPGAAAATTQVIAYYSRDGFASVQSIVQPAGLSHPSVGLRTPLDDGVSGDPGRAVQTDRYGDFYVAITERAAASSGWTRQSYWRFALPSAQSGLPAPDTLSRYPAKPAVLCTLSLDQHDGAGSLAYDGRHLLYTMVDDSAATSTQGVIREIDPMTCLDAGEILVSFSARDLAWITSATACRIYAVSDRGEIGIDNMTYDQNRNLLWASLFDYGDSGPDGSWGCGQYLFQISVSRASTPTVPGVAHAVLALRSGCNVSLTYDYTDDTLWTCDGTTTMYKAAPQPERGGHISAADGHRIVTCMTDAVNNETRTEAPGPWSWASWVVAPPKMYVWDEDDQTVYEWNYANCELIGILTHDNLGEAGAEDEEMACDPLTFGPGSPALVNRPPTQVGVVPVTGQMSLLWLRGTNGILAYRLPGGLCPLPTEVLYSGSPRVTVQQDASVCAVLDQRFPGGVIPRSQPVQLTYAGISDAGVRVHGAIPGSIVTDSSGTPVCSAWHDGLPPGDYQITAAFAGTDQLLRSAAVGHLRVDDVPHSQQRVPHLPPAALLAPVLIVPPPPAPVPQPQPLQQISGATQSEVQAQAQSQAQSQTNAQMQPGFMTQPQRQRQVAMQTASTTQAQAETMLATAVRRRTAAWSWVTGAAAAAIALALGVAGRRVRPATVRDAAALHPRRARTRRRR